MARTFSPCTPRLSHSPKPFFPCNSPLHSPIFQYTDHSMLCFFAPRNFAGAAECSVPLPTSRKKVRAPKFLRKRQRNIYPTRGQLLACARCARARAVGLNVGEGGGGDEPAPSQSRAKARAPANANTNCLVLFVHVYYPVVHYTYGYLGEKLVTTLAFGNTLRPPCYESTVHTAHCLRGPFSPPLPLPIRGPHLLSSNSPFSPHSKQPSILRSPSSVSPTPPFV